MAKRLPFDFTFYMYSLYLPAYLSQIQGDPLSHFFARFACSVRWFQTRQPEASGRLGAKTLLTSAQTVTRLDSLYSLIGSQIKSQSKFITKQLNKTFAIMVHSSSIIHADAADADATISAIVDHADKKNGMIDHTNKKNDMSDNIDSIKAYFSTLDGKPDSFERFEEQFHKLIHPDVVVKSYQHDDMKYDDLIHLVKTHFIPKGCISELLEVIDNGDGTLTSVVNNHLPGEDGDVTYQRAYFNDEGMVVKVMTTSQFGDLVDRVEALSRKEGV